jgi:molybdopterin converting factor small subunit
MFAARGFQGRQDTMRITITFSTLFRTLAGVEQDVLDVDDGTTVDRLFRILEQKYKKLPLEGRKTYFQINGHVSTPDQVLAEGDQVRVFQLAAGG